MSLISAPEAFASANALFVDEDYEGARVQYNLAIDLDSNNAEYLVHRAACHLRLASYRDAVADASRALELNPQDLRALLRKGTGLFHLEEYADARAALAAGVALDPTNSQFRTWLRKCDAELGSGSATTAPPVPEPKEETKKVETKTKTGTDVVKHDWYQSEDFVTVELRVKGAKEADTVVDLEETSLCVEAKLSSHREFQFHIDLCDSIDPRASRVSFLSTKIELKLKKLRQVYWESLEARPGCNVRPIGSSSSSANAQVYPSSMGSRNWDTIVSAEETAEEKSIDKVFQEIYQNATDEQRQAMVKSFTESGGTVLSTNWQDVGSRHVTCTPPDGMEPRPWDA